MVLRDEEGERGFPERGGEDSPSIESVVDKDADDGWIATRSSRTIADERRMRRMLRRMLRKEAIIVR